MLTINMEKMEKWLRITLANEESGLIAVLYADKKGKITSEAQQFLQLESEKPQYYQCDDNSLHIYYNNDKYNIEIVDQNGDSHKFKANTIKFHR